VVVTIGVIACGKAKLDHPAPARELYTGNLFRAAREYVETRCDEWFILSAKHGLVLPDDVLAPYELYLAATTPRYQAAWNLRVGRQVTRYVGPRNARLVVLAGTAYRAWSATSLYPIETPLRGLGMGKQLAYLTKANALPARVTP
jgi:hypothetical protein